MSKRQWTGLGILTFLVAIIFGGMATYSMEAAVILFLSSVGMIVFAVALAAGLVMLFDL